MAPDRISGRQRAIDAPFCRSVAEAGSPDKWQFEGDFARRDDQLRWIGLECSVVAPVQPVSAAPAGLRRLSGGKPLPAMWIGQPETMRPRMTLHCQGSFESEWTRNCELSRLARMQQRDWPIEQSGSIRKLRQLESGGVRSI